MGSLVGQGPLIQVARVAAFVSLVAWYRRGQLLPTTMAERQLWSITAGHFWGVFYAFGAAFLALSIAMCFNLLWAPLEYGALWAVVLVAVGLHLRRLGAAAVSPQIPSAK